MMDDFDISFKLLVLFVRWERNHRHASATPCISARTLKSRTDPTL